MISIDGVKITPTVFPDGTSQVWKLPEELLQKLYKEPVCTITWEWEFKSGAEAEFIQLAQLKTLLDTYCDVINLNMPYLPYGRQDKRIENTSTFGLHTFAKLLNALNFNEVHVIDAHNNLRANMINRLEDHAPRTMIEEALRATKADMLLYPDSGALKRYSALRPTLYCDDNGKPDRDFSPPYVYAEKVREQSTGLIKGITIVGKVKDKKLLIVDDICDGGMTFKLVAEQALKVGAKEVHLFVSHGIFSRGLETLRESGIKRIFTHKGEEPLVTVPVYDGGH